MVTDGGGDGGGEAVFTNVAGVIQLENLGRIAVMGMNGMFSGGVPGLPANRVCAIGTLVAAATK
jgi:hypothetical protein